MHPTRKNRVIVKCANPECNNTTEKHMAFISSLHPKSEICCSRKCKNSRFILDYYNKLKIEMYGYDNLFNVPEIQAKCQLTNPFKSKEGQQKCIQGRLKKYGVEYAQQNPVIKAKTQKTIIDKYGSITNYHKHVKAKAYLTQVKKYGSWFFASTAGRMTIGNLREKWGYSDEQIDLLLKKRARRSGTISKKSLRCIHEILTRLDYVITQRALYGKEELILNHGNGVYKYDLVIDNKIIEFNEFFNI